MMYFFSHDRIRRNGFTLIELMVTITVIGILVAIVYANFSQARMQARDKARINQLEQIRVAIELYKDKYGRYPAAGCGATPYNGPGWKWIGPGPAGANSLECAVYIAGLAPEFIDTLPLDPSREMDPERGYIYQATVNGSAYKLMANRVVESEVVQYQHPFARCPFEPGQPPCRAATSMVCGNPAAGGGVDGTAYAIYSAGAECW